MARPSDTELRLLKALWASGRASAREIHDRTSAETGWSPSATRKTLDRMAEKGLVRIETVHGVKVFVPTRTKVETLASLIRRFARDVLDKETPLPAAAFTGSKLLSDDEIADLEAMLSEKDTDDDGEAGR